jgi:hypothetical protein
VAQRVSDEAGRHLSDNATSMIPDPRRASRQITRLDGRNNRHDRQPDRRIATMSALRKALNRIYDFKENKPFLKRKALELALTLGAGSLGLRGNALHSHGALPLRQHRALAELVSIGFAIALVLVAVSLVYWLLPAHKEADENPFRWNHSRRCSLWRRLDRVPR